MLEKVKQLVGRKEVEVTERLRRIDWAIDPHSETLSHIYAVAEMDDGKERWLEHRVACLGLLTYLPIELRENAGFLQRARTILRGLYNAQGRIAPEGSVEMLNLTSGIFHPDRIGVAQMYGVVASYRSSAEPGQLRGPKENSEFVETVEEAYRERIMATPPVRKINQLPADRLPALPEPTSPFGHAYMIAHQAYQALNASFLAAFEQCRLEPVDKNIALWTRQALLSMPYVASIIGNPDPRQNPRGMGRDQDSTQERPQAGPDGAYAIQQLETMLRGLAAAEQDFLFYSLLRRVPLERINLMLEAVAQEASIWASRQRGSRAINLGFSVPVILAAASSFGTGQSYGTSHATGTSDGVGESTGVAHTVGTAHSVGHSTGTSVGETQSISHSQSTTTSETTTTGISEGFSHGIGHADSTSVSDTSGHATSTGSNWGTSDSTGHSTSSEVSHAVSDGTAHGTSQVVTDGSSHSTSSGSNWGSSSASSSSWGTGVSHGTTSTSTIGESASAQVGVDAGVQLGGSVGVSASNSQGVTDTTSSSVGGSVTTTHSSGGFSGVSDTTSHSVSNGVSDSVSHSVSNGTSSGVSDSVGHSVSSGGSLSDTASTAHSQGTGTSDSTNASWSVGSSRAHSSSIAQSTAETQGVAYSKGASESSSVSDTASESTSTARNVSRAHSTSESDGVAESMGLSRSLGFSGSVGLGPSLSASKSYNWEDDSAQILTNIYRLAEAYLFDASREGAYLTDVYCIAKSEEGLRTLESLATQALAGTQDVLAPILTRRLSGLDRLEVLNRALLLATSEAEEEVPGVLSAYKHATLLPLIQAAIYFAPAAFEEGTALTMQERIPPFAFISDLKGEVELASLISPETGMATESRVRLGRDTIANFLFAGDTGSGKSVAAERLALETAARWNYRTIVLDFGAGWRRILDNTLIPGERQYLYQLHPGATRPLYWNPLQIGLRVDPEEQLLATVNLLANAGRMGERQVGFMRETLRQLYSDYGVIVNDSNNGTPASWSHVQPDEAAELRQLEYTSVQEGMFVNSLPRAARHAVLRYRSRRVTLREWYRRLLDKFNSLSDKNQTDRTAIQGVLLRLEPFAVGKLADMYNISEGAVALEDLAYPSGLCIIEGGAAMDEYSRAALFSLIAWHIYTDAVARRRETSGRDMQPVQIFFEEANKVLTGVSSGPQSDSGTRSQVSDIFESMWRDSRKYSIYLHLMCQSPSEIPPGIISSCNNSFIFQLKNAKDRDMAMSQIARSERGFVDENYKRFMSRMPRGTAILKLGLSPDVAKNEPMYVRPLMVQASEPDEGRLKYLVANKATQPGG